MNFKWQGRPFRGRIEHRSADATQVLIKLIQAQSSGEHLDTDPNTTAAVEIASRIYGNALAAGKVMPESAARIITPAVLNSIGRSLIRKGESTYLIDTSRGRIELSEATSWDVQGGPSPSSWRFRLDLPGPSTQLRRTVVYDGLLHFRWSYDPATPWKGFGPLHSAPSTGRLMAAVEGHLADEATTPRGYVMPLPMGNEDDEEDDPLAGMKAEMLKLRGKLGFVETTAAGYGEGRGAAPAQDWKTKRIGAAPSESLCKLREDAATSVLAACGIPTSMMSSRSDGTAQRESFRFWAVSALNPLARLLEQEVREKLEIMDFGISFQELFASDIQGRARSLKAMVDAGMDLERAAAAAGLR